MDTEINSGQGSSLTSAIFLILITVAITGCGGGGGQTQTNDAAIDSDGDGQSNLQESLDGTDPTIPETTTYYQDADADDYGDPVVSQTATTQPAGYVLDSTDCDDTSAAVNPGETEVNDGIDNDCDGQVDETITTKPLNDTGITFGGNYPSGNNATCIGETIGQQDCSHGRDVTHNDDSDGHAGFSYTKLDLNGNDLPVSAPAWSCVRDNVTGLIWEVKQGGNGITGDEGLHDADDRYNWYNTDPATNGSSNGYANDDAAICHGYSAGAAIYCNTQAYTAQVNAATLCGASDWRMPSRTELFGLVNRNRWYPAIDITYFPNTEGSVYWSSSPYANDSSYAWNVGFYSGDSNASGRNNANAVRLVRGGQ